MVRHFNLKTIVNLSDFNNFYQFILPDMKRKNRFRIIL